MALFFEFRAKAQTLRNEPVCMEWCKSDSILAVGTASKTVEFFLEEGEHVKESTIRRKCNPAAMAWHPRARSSSLDGTAERSYSMTLKTSS